MGIAKFIRTFRFSEHFLDKETVIYTGFFICIKDSFNLKPVWPQSFFQTCFSSLEGNQNHERRKFLAGNRKAEEKQQVKVITPGSRTQSLGTKAREIASATAAAHITEKSNLLK